MSSKGGGCCCCDYIWGWVKKGAVWTHVSALEADVIVCWICMKWHNARPKRWKRRTFDRKEPHSGCATAGINSKWTNSSQAGKTKLYIWWEWSGIVTMDLDACQWNVFEMSPQGLGPACYLPSPLRCWGMHQADNGAICGKFSSDHAWQLHGKAGVD